MNKIVTQARSWLGTPFKHQARLKHVGCDCIGLIVGVVGELDLTSINGTKLIDYDAHGYSRLPDGQLLQQGLEACLQPSDNMQAGDVVMMKFRDEPQHVGIVSDYGDEFGLIHCYAEAGKVVEHHLDELWSSRVLKSYRIG